MSRNHIQKLLGISKYQILIVLFVMLFGNNIFAQPSRPTRHGLTKDEAIEADNQTGPIGTATGVLLGLGAMACCYKIYKNNKNKK